MFFSQDLYKGYVIIPYNANQFMNKILATLLLIVTPKITKCETLLVLL
jgi:hypothetical protein